MTTLLFLMGIAVGLLSASAADSQPQPAAATSAAPHNLRCEYLTDPLGIDEPAPRLSWELADSRRGAMQHAYQVLVADRVELLRDEVGNVWDSGEVQSEQSIQVVYAGQPLRSRMRVWWKVRVWDQKDEPSAWSEPAFWSMGLLDPNDWQASWIGPPTLLPPPARPHDGAASQPSTEPASKPAGELEPLPALMLRKVFHLQDPPPRPGPRAPLPPPPTGPVTRATVYVTALGLYELCINGQRVGDHVLAPEWTDYRTRLQYQTYDVTSLISPDENVVAAWLGDGWYAGRIGLAGIVPGGPARAIYGRQPWLLLQMDIEFASGRIKRVWSDGSWHVTAEGPIRSSDILDGETYDARREMRGWDAPGFNDASWKPVITCDIHLPRTPGHATEPPVAGQPLLVAQPNEAIRVVQDLTPIALTEPEPGKYVYDLGQNMVGWCRMKLSGPAGTTVTLRHAEVLNPDGTIYTANLRGARQTDVYTLRGGDDEVFEPRFTYHGFRYVEVSGLPEKPALEALTGLVLHSAVRPAASEAGKFECSDPLLNKLMANIVWTQRGNMPGVPTDCPQRDERLGWMGDILAFAQTASFNFDMAGFFTKWVTDVRDAQTADGRYPDFAPHPFDPAARFSSAPAWGDAGVFVPWCAYVNYADRRLLQRHFDSARRWVDYVREKNPDLLWKNARGNDYGDWLNADTLKLEGWPKSGAEVPKEVFATMFFARSTELVAKMAAVLGRHDEAEKYAQLAREIRAAFQAAYTTEDGHMLGDTQAGYALALHFDLLPESQRVAAARYMLRAFDTYHGNISTGFHSTICLMQELTRYGYNEQAYRLIMNRTMPSWGYAIDHGATTIWERWDGYVEGRGFQDPGMNSFCHYALGSVGEWMYRVILGINPDEATPGYKHFFIRPRPGGGLTWARGEYLSPYGRIASDWKIADGRFTLALTVPPNTTATVELPAADVAAVTESGGPAQQAEGVTFISAAEGTALFRVVAGEYTFAVPWPERPRAQGE